MHHKNAEILLHIFTLLKVQDFKASGLIMKIFQSTYEYLDGVRNLAGLNLQSAGTKKGEKIGLNQIKGTVQRDGRGTCYTSFKSSFQWQIDTMP